MSVAGSISNALLRFGRQMTLRRQTLVAGAAPNNQVPLDVAVYGVTKNYAENEIIGTIIQGDTKVTITNTEIAAAQWPGPPKPGDKMVIDGKPRTVGAVEPKYLGTGILVYVMQVTG